MSTGNGIVWAGLGLIGMCFLLPDCSGSGAEPPTNDDKPVAGRAEAAVSKRPVRQGIAAQDLTRSGDGHFYAEVIVNGTPITFMVDTGATMVALTPDDARRAGIRMGPMRSMARGVGGVVEVTPVMIDRMTLGTIDAENVRGAVAEELDVSLLGQSFLAEVDRVEIRGDRMVLR